MKSRNHDYDLTAQSIVTLLTFPPRFSTGVAIYSPRKEGYIQKTIVRTASEGEGYELPSL